MNMQTTTPKNYTALLQPSSSARIVSPKLFFRWGALFVLLALAAESHAQMTVQLTPASNAWAYNVSNHGGADGSIVSGVSGGTTPFSYVWTKGSDTVGVNQNVNGLTAGLYQLVVEDSLGLRDTASVYLSQPSGLSSSITPHDPCGLASNSATAYPTGAVGPYSYAWDTGDSLATANGLSAGVHAVLITAANGDTVTTHCTIHTPLELELEAMANSFGNHLACAGDTALVDLTVSGGVPPYTYLWESGSFSQDLQATTSGLKKVRVWDSRGCTADDSLLLVAASALNMEVQPHLYPNGQGFSCDTCNDGMFVVMTMGGGEPPYSIAWSTGAAGDTLFNIIPDTMYSVTISDAQGCEWTDGGAMPRGSLQNSNALNLVVDAPHWAGGYHVSCSTCADAKVLLYPSGGQPPYAILWADGDTSRYRYGMTAGDYSVMIFDQAGDSLKRNVTLIGPSAALAVSLSAKTGGCASWWYQNIYAYVNGGTPPYSYRWALGDSLFDATYQFSYLNAPDSGLYKVIVVDANADTVSAQYAAVSAPSEITTTLSAPLVQGNYHATCYGDTVQISLDVSGGNGPFFYNWEHGSFQQNPAVTTGNLYKVRVTDKFGCGKNDSIQINIPNKLKPKITPQLYPDGQAFSCDTCNDGVVIIDTITGGIAPYSILWGDGSTGNTLTNIYADSISSILITDALGCEFEVSGSLPRGPISGELPVEKSQYAGGFNVSCFGCLDGWVRIFPQGGTPPYTLLWSDGDTSRYRTGMGIGTYSITVTDSEGRNAIREVTMIGPSNELAVYLKESTGGCGSTWYQNINAYVNGGTPPYSYRWALGDSLFDATYQFSYLNAPDSGLYKVIVVDANADTVTAQYAAMSAPSEIITSLSAPLVQGNYHATCYGDTVQISLDVTGGNGSFFYTWEHGSFQQNPMVTSSSWYKVRVTGMYGCVMTDSIQIKIPDKLETEIEPQLHPDGQAFSCDTCNDGVLVMDTIVGGVAPYSILWGDGSTGNSMTNIYADSAIGIMITDALGCVFNISGSLPRGNLSQQGDGTNIEKSSYAGGYNVSCYGCMDGWVQIHAYGGQPPYTFLWADGDTSRYRTGMGAGTYSITVTEGGGHSGTREVVLLGPSAGLDAQISNMTTVNNGLITGGLNAMVNGGVPPYSYVWKKDGSVLTNTWSYLSVSQSGTYSLVVTDATSGMDSATVVIALPEDTTMEADAPPAWGMYGNAGNGDILEGEGAPWFGTADSTDVVMKANGVPQLRLGANGVTSVEGQFRLANTVDNSSRMLWADENGLVRKLNDTVPLFDTYESIPVLSDSMGQLPQGFAPPVLKSGILGSRGGGCVPGQWKNLTISSSEGSPDLQPCHDGNIRIGGSVFYYDGDEYEHWANARLHVHAKVAGAHSKYNLSLSRESVNTSYRVGISTNTENKNILLFDALTNSNGSPFGGFAQVLSLQQDGNVGIGTRTPGSRLSVNGNLDVGGTKLFVNAASGNVGIGTSSPDARLDVSDLGGNPALRVFSDGKLVAGALTVLPNNGNVGIGTTNPAYDLEVHGTVKTFMIRVCVSGCDYVFSEDYHLRSIPELEAYVAKHKHLPDVASAEEMEHNEGYDLGVLGSSLLKKVEELTLYIIQLEKRITELESN